jgi:hypothetical protein
MRAVVPMTASAAGLRRRIVEGLSSLECRICGTPVDPRRVELGYDYCTADECQRRCVEQPRLVRVAVNKAADQFVRAEAVLPQGEVAGNRLDETPIAGASRGGRPPRRRRVGTLEKLRVAEAELDRRLEESFQRFSRSEITAEGMAQERDELIRAYNRRVMAENIRYRSMLRQRRSA